MCYYFLYFLSSSTCPTLLNTLCMHVNVNLLSKLVLVGDFNVNVSDPEHTLFSNLLSMSSSLCLTPAYSVA